MEQKPIPPKMTTIKITWDTRDRLMGFGRKDMTWNEIVRIVIAKAEAFNLQNEIKKAGCGCLAAEPGPHSDPLVAEQLAQNKYVEHDSDWTSDPKLRKQ